MSVQPSTKLSLRLFFLELAAFPRTLRAAVWLSIAFGLGAGIVAWLQPLGNASPLDSIQGVLLQAGFNFVAMLIPALLVAFVRMRIGSERSMLNLASTLVLFSLYGLISTITVQIPFALLAGMQINWIVSVRSLPIFLGCCAFWVLQLYLVSRHTVKQKVA